ncbi:ArsR/SmtB family transcription factor [Azospirillum picis]|uniref:DNA-binding transcriptional ArsR family regulator n=1 Tax=Azospirillum picis TaxID=488438 RepID=A0ABU0MNG5_9PROT|nr:winged helix-turn-helix domain-containing protein [Azospirillum picis]MBP2301807.1 DNA-binding transcriptional ArsR family regulator [Azospirillum picis]MDQ0535018.1 DNA-binding transcriptional ArsR family regulator [Azospirillum picis]
MVTPNQLAEVAAAIGEPARAAMLVALMDGRALTAGELAEVAAVTPQTASGHLAKMVAAHLIVGEKQGRHRYHRLAGADVAVLIESMMRIGGGGPALRKPLRVGPRDAALRAARTCYDHLAGQLGVRISDALVAMGAVEIEGDNGLVTRRGLELMAEVGIALPVHPRPRAPRPLCRPCLDWSERRPHIAGQLGAALCAHAFERAWVRRIGGSRALEVTPHGKTALREAFGIRTDG